MMPPRRRLQRTVGDAAAPASHPRVVVAAAPDRLIAGSYDSHIYIWDFPSCNFLHLLSGHRSAVRSLVIYNGCLMSGRCGPVSRVPICRSWGQRNLWAA